jgi:hypothetical protein
MEKKSKIIIMVFAILVIISTIITFYRYIVLEDIIFITDEEAFQESLLEE